MYLVQVCSSAQGTLGSVWKCLAGNNGGSSPHLQEEAAGAA